MSTHRIETTNCKRFFDQVSQHLVQTRVSVQVNGERLGSQTEMENLTLLGLSYDPTRDEIDIITEEGDHHVVHPREVYVDTDVDGLHSVKVLDDDGNEQIIQLKSPLKLPPGNA